MKKRSRLIRRHIDPSFNMSVNSIQDPYYVSRRKYKFDIARTPQVVKGSMGGGIQHVNIHRHVKRVNDEVYCANKKKHRVKGVV